MDMLELAGRFIHAVEVGELEAVRACYAADARIWHNFDDVEQTVEENMKVLEWMKRKTTRRTYEVTRLEEIAGGYLQQHVLRMQKPDGTEIAMPACLIVTVKDGRITRLEEYLDPSPTRAL
jgi:ketosteroid isomerase-like protein